MKALWDRRQSFSQGSDADGKIDFDQIADISITEQFWRAFIEERDVRDILSELGLSQDDTTDLFIILDADKSGTLDLEEIVSGILKVRGDAKRSDVVTVGLLVQATHEALRNFEFLLIRMLQDQNNMLLKMAHSLH